MIDMKGHWEKKLNPGQQYEEMSSLDKLMKVLQQGNS